MPPTWAQTYWSRDADKALLALARECQACFPADRCPPAMQRQVYQALSTGRVSLALRKQVSPERMREIHARLNVTDQEFYLFLDCVDRTLGFSPRSWFLRDMRDHVVSISFDSVEKHGSITISSTEPHHITEMSSNLAAAMEYSSEDFPLPMSRLRGPLTDRDEARQLLVAARAGQACSASFVNYTRSGTPVQLKMTTLPLTEKDVYFAVATVSPLAAEPLGMAPTPSFVPEPSPWQTFT